jgi:hypothetical protein
MNELYIIVFSSLIFCIIISIGFSQFLKQILRLHRVKNFPSYHLVFTFYLDRAYDIVYKDRIFTFSVEGYTLSDKEHADVMKEYAKLVIKMLGPELHKDLVSMYGSVDTLLFNIFDYFNEKYENDEIRGSALDNISNKEENEETK